MLKVAVFCISQLPQLLFLAGSEIKHYPIRKGLGVDFPVQAYRTKKLRDVTIPIR